ncbi:hypothetical protein [Devosia sp.]|uniref:hypothetical protein n=1 Tax=Devosia sp. TaxID=1871048 RepID=UPI001AD08CCA|nr:hypothetical protein [Devosia sp.]MBN9335284.1 hypothetical protein [Devosia sp.]
MEWIALLLIGFALVGFWLQASNRKAEERRLVEERASRIEYVRRKYAGSPFIEDILQGNIRQGMTREQVIDAWGLPAAQDERVLKTKVVHTLKYGQSGRSFRQQVKIENGAVVGWTTK